MNEIEIHLISERLRIAKDEFQQEKMKPKSKRNERTYQDAKKRINTLSSWLRK